MLISSVAENMHCLRRKGAPAMWEAIKMVAIFDEVDVDMECIKDVTELAAKKPKGPVRKSVVTVAH